MSTRCFIVMFAALCLVMTGCGKKEAATSAPAAVKPVQTPQTIEEEYIFTKKSDYVEKCEGDLDALEILLGKIREELTGSSSSMDPLQAEEIIKGLYERLDYADEVLDRLRMSAADGWKGDQQFVLKAIAALEEASAEVMQDIGMPKS